MSSSSASGTGRERQAQDRHRTSQIFVVTAIGAQLPADVTFAAQRRADGR